MNELVDIRIRRRQSLDNCLFSLLDLSRNEAPFIVQLFDGLLGCRVLDSVKL